MESDFLFIQIHLWTIGETTPSMVSADRGAKTSQPPSTGDNGMTHFTKLIPLAALATTISLSAQCQSGSKTSMSDPDHEVVQDSQDAPRQNIVQVAASAGSFNTLVAAVKAAGLVDTLSGKGPFTVFAPSDEAFARLPKGTVERLLEDKKALARILTYHVVPGKVLSSDLSGNTFAPTAEGQSLYIQAGKKGVRVDSARVMKADIMATNGVIHVIDTVIMPRKNTVQTAVEAGSFKTLAKALKATGLDKSLAGKGPFTVFAPTDEAFAKLPKGTVEALLQDKARLEAILLYHVVAGRTMSASIPAPGKDKKQVLTDAKTLQGTPLTLKRTNKGVWVDGAQVIKADILTGNGVIHVIDQVILPSDN